MYDDLGYYFMQLWNDQAKYNEKIKLIQERSVAEWCETYLLGISTEFSEILHEIQWKKHRKDEFEPKIDRNNMADELADLTKYVLSLWQLFGFDIEDMLKFTQQKTEYLEMKLTQEFGAGPKPDQVVLICDIDGTIGNYYKTFLYWLEHYEKFQLPENLDREDSFTLQMDQELRISYGFYHNFKDKFERSGGYGYVEPYQDGIKFLKDAQANGAYIMMVTARPIYEMATVGVDTWRWLQHYQIVPDRLLAGSTERLLIAEKYKSSRIIVLEDDPVLAKRAAQIAPVLVRPHKYNENLIEGVDKFPLLRTSEWTWELIEKIMERVYAGV